MLTTLSIIIDNITTSIRKMFSNKGKGLVVPIGCQNVKKREKYKVAALEVLYMISIYINKTDKQYIKDFNRVKNKQEGLCAKYSKTTLQATHKLIRKITTFLLREDTTVKDTWTKLKELQRDVITVNPAQKSTFTNNKLFDYLLEGLPNKYLTISSVINS